MMDILDLNSNIILLRQMKTLLVPCGSVWLVVSTFECSSMTGVVHSGLEMRSMATKAGRSDFNGMSQVYKEGSWSSPAMDPETYASSLDTIDRLTSVCRCRAATVMLPIGMH